MGKCSKMWQHVRTEIKVWQNVADLWPFCKNNVCPDPVSGVLGERRREERGGAAAGTTGMSHKMGVFVNEAQKWR